MMRTDIFLIFALRKVALGNQKTRFHCNRLHFPYHKKTVKNKTINNKIRKRRNQQNLLIMQSKAKKYGEYVEITAPVERTTSEEYPTLLGGEIWYN